MNREERQKEASDSFNEGDKAMIIAAPRFGKIKTTIDIMNRIKPIKILIVYPRTDIQTGWESDFKKWGFNSSIIYSTYKSVHKHIYIKWDMIILDEIHEASDKQLDNIRELDSKTILGLTGTVTKTTERNIFQRTGIVPCYEYTIEQAVNEKILCDYEITLHKVDLDDKIKEKGFTEKQRFARLKYVFEKLKVQKKDTFHIYVKQIQLIQKSISKIQKTKDLLSKFRGDRILVFCGLTEVADALEIPAYHSKAKEHRIFDEFCSGESVLGTLATIKMAQAGVTIKPINRGIINYTSGNPEDTAQKICRFLGLEYDNPDKKAYIDMVVCSDKFEMDKMATALMFFDKNKIKEI